MGVVALRDRLLSVLVAHGSFLACISSSKDGT